SLRAQWPPQQAHGLQHPAPAGPRELNYHVGPRAHLPALDLPPRHREFPAQLHPPGTASWKDGKGAVACAPQRVAQAELGLGQVRIAGVDQAHKQTDAYFRAQISGLLHLVEAHQVATVLALRRPGESQYSHERDNHGQTTCGSHQFPPFPSRWRVGSSGQLPRASRLKEAARSDFVNLPTLLGAIEIE